jgi:hypothetical protein
MPDVVWPVTWAFLGLLLSLFAVRRAWVQHRIACRESAAVRRYEELREGEYASIGGTAEMERGGTGRMHVVMEGNRKVRVEPEHRGRMDAALAKETPPDDFLAVQAERPVYVAGIVERAPDGFVLHAVPGQRMAIATEPLWQRATRRRFRHALIAFLIAGATIECFRFLAWDLFRLALEGTPVIATLSNLRDIDEERFSLRAMGFVKVRKTELDADYVDDQRRPRRFTAVVDPKTEWLWSLRADQAEVRRLGIEPVRQWFVILPDDPSVQQLSREPHISATAALVPFMGLALAAILYLLIVVRPEVRPRGRRRRGRVVTPSGPAA